MNSIISDKKGPVYWFSRISVYVLVKLLMRVRVIGKENIPRSGPLILSSNHIHNFDPPIIGALFPRYAYFMAKSQLFKSRIMERFMTELGAFPVKRGGQDKAAIRMALSVPESGNCLIIFPEGHRSKTGELGPGQPGVAFIARKSNCPVIPVAVIGPYKLWGKLTIRYGEMITVSPDDTNDQVLEVLMSAIQKLLNEGHAK